MKNLITCLTVGLLSGTTFADTWTVDDDGKADFDNIQDAVDAASNGDTIEVLEGTYFQGFTITGKEVIVRGEINSDGVPVVTIDGGGNVITSNGNSPKTVIENFIITGGEVNGSQQTQGGGMHLFASQLTMSNCTFVGNSGHLGGAVFMDWYSAPTFTDCSFVNNSADAYTSSQGGGVYANDSTPTFINCVFHENTATEDGGGLLLRSSGAQLIDCSISDNTATNWGGGIKFIGGGILTRCTFESNESNIGGGIHTSSSSVFIGDCDFRQNLAVSGGAIFSSSGSPNLVSCIVCENAVPQLMGDWIDGGQNLITDVCGLGACCTGNQASCVMSTQLDCEYFGGNFQGYGVECIDVSCQTSCLGDVTGDGQVDVSDVLVVISVWGACP